MRVRFTRRALRDVLAIAEYIRERNPAAARRVEAAIRSTVYRLGRHPLLGRERPELDARSLAVPRYPYTAYYRIEDNDVVIVHIRHNRRRPLDPGNV